MFTFLLLACASDSLTLFPPDKKPADKRLGPVRTLNDKDFNLKVPANRDAWLRRAKAVREQMFVSQGLWPMWAREKLAPTINNGVVRDGYRVDAVSFASTPGHYVTGSLYRPTDKDGTVKPGPHPAVLVAHGHWAEGRMHDPGEAAAKREIASKAESHLPNAR